MANQNNESEIERMQLQMAILNSLAETTAEEEEEKVAGGSQDLQQPEVPPEDGAEPTEIPVEDVAEEDKTNETEAEASQSRHVRQSTLHIHRDGAILVGRRTPNTVLKYPHLSFVDLAADRNSAITSVATCASSPRGSLLAATSDDSTVRVWSLAPIRLVAQLEAHKGASWCVSFSPDGTKVISGGADHSCILWSLATLQPIFRLIGHTNDVERCMFSRDGRHIATASSDGTVRLWNGRTGQMRKSLVHNSLVMNMCISPDSQRVATCAVFDGLIWSIEDGTCLAKLEAHQGMLWDINFSHDGTRIVTSSEDGSARIWNAENGTELVRLHEHSDPVSTLR